MNVADLLLRRAELHGRRDAVIDRARCGTRSLSFAALEERSARGAGLLRALGLAPGDRVLILVPMSADLYVIVLACLRLGLVPTFIDPGAGRRHLDRCCDEARPKAFVATPRGHLLRAFCKGLRRIEKKVCVGAPVPGAIVWRNVARHPPHDAVSPCQSDTPAVLTYTSGSTGPPKATIRTHGLLRAQHRALSRTLELRPGLVDLATLPLFVLANLASGVTSVLAAGDLRRPGRIDPRPLVAQITRHGATRITGSPALLERLTRYCAKTSTLLPGLTEIATGGAPVFPGLINEIRRVAPNARVMAVYGATEAEPIAVFSIDGLADMESSGTNGRGLLAGPPVAEVQLRILEDSWGSELGALSPEAFDAMTLPAYAIGEIVVAGEHVVQRYEAAEHDAATKITVGSLVWHRTGDAGSLDHRGRLWLHGRCEAKATSAAGVQYPLAVESAALSHPSVLRAAFVGQSGRRILAVQLSTGTTNGIRPVLAERTAWAQLDRIEVLRAIPVDRRHNAKTDYAALRPMLRRRSPPRGLDPSTTHGGTPDTRVGERV